MIARLARAALALVAFAALLYTAFAASAWMHDVREHAGRVHGPGVAALALGLLTLAASGAGLFALRERR